MERFERVETKDGYTVTFSYASSSSDFVVVVKHGNSHVATSGLMSSHEGAAKWARGKIRGHRRALRLLADT